jgi:hypothetical protein
MNKRTIMWSLGFISWCCLVCATSAQKITLESGGLGFLKGQAILNLEYVYENVKVGKKTEEEYVQGKVQERDKKQPGAGEKWLSSWKDDRPSRFQPRFEEEMNKALSRRKLNVRTDQTNAPYTLVLRTLLVDPGWGFMPGMIMSMGRHDARLDVVAVFVETGSRGKELARVTVTRVPGRGAVFTGTDLDSGYRLQEAYAKCGKELGRFIAKRTQP